MQFGKIERGQWVGNAQISTQKAVPITIRFKVGSLDLMRMDITTVSGFYVGSVLVEGDRFQALSARDKKFYQGRVDAKTMHKIFAVPLDPRWLPRILFETPAENWECEYSDKGYLSRCSQPEAGFIVTWQERVRDQRKLHLQIEKHEVSLFLSQFQPQIEKAEQAFQLSAPSGFQVVQIK